MEDEGDVVRLAKISARTFGGSASTSTMPCVQHVRSHDYYHYR